MAPIPGEHPAPAAAHWRIVIDEIEVGANAPSATIARALERSMLRDAGELVPPTTRDAVAREVAGTVSAASDVAGARGHDGPPPAPRRAGS